MNRKERKEEERRILAELDEAVALEREQAAEKREEQTAKEERRGDFYASADPEKVHCRRCKTLMENGVCPTCGYKMYVPMTDAQRRKTRGVVAAVCIGVFVLLFLLLKL